MTDTIALDDFGQLAKTKYVATVEDYNAQVIASKSVDSIEDFKENFQLTWEGVKDINAKIDEVESALESLYAKRMLKVEPVLQAEYEKALSESGIDPEALNALLKTINATKKYLVLMYGDDVLEDTPKVEGRRSSGGTGGGTGGRRIRGFDVYIDGALAGTPNKDGVVKSTFSAAAKELGVETVALQRAFFEAAGSEDVKSDEFPAVVDFDFDDKKVRVTKDDSDSE